MKGLAVALIVVSLGFGIFSVAYGLEYGEHRNYRADPETSRLDDIAKDEIHTTVKAVSIPFFLFCLGFFAKAVMRRGARKFAIPGILISFVMFGWTLLLSRAVSFDEVFVAWVAAALLLALLEGLTAWALARPA
jgi:hypothetical protein